MPAIFDESIRGMQTGIIPTSREFVCPLCGGTAHLRAGTLPARPTDWLWMEAWCEDCGAVEKHDGVQSWPGIEPLLATEAEYYTLEDNLQRIRRFADKGRQIQALRLYRQIYNVDLRQAQIAIEEMMSKERT